jgi:hypothetical protein
MVNTEFMMYSPFDPQWYTNVYWLLDPIPGGEVTDDSWRGLMQNQCRPVWITFGDSLQEKTGEAMTQIGTVSSTRGFSDPSNTGGDVIFAFANIKKLGAFLSAPEFGAPSVAAVSSVFRSPTHVLYVAGMEYKRFYGVLSSERIQTECDELASVMQQFRSNSGVEGCPAVDIIEEEGAEWSGPEYSFVDGTPGVSETSTWEGGSAGAIAGTYFAGDGFVWSGTNSTVQPGNIQVSEEVNATSAQTLIENGSSKTIEFVEYRVIHSFDEEGYTPPILGQRGTFLVEEQSEWNPSPIVVSNGSSKTTDLSTWQGDIALAEDGTSLITEQTSWDQTEILVSDGMPDIIEQTSWDQTEILAVDGSFDVEDKVEWITQPALNLEGLFEIDEEVNEWNLTPVSSLEGSSGVSELINWEQISFPQESGGNFNTFDSGWNGDGGGGIIINPPRQL